MKKSYQLKYLADATGMHAVSGPTIRRAEVEFGNALLTRRETTKVRLHDLSFPRCQPRGVIDAEFEIDGKRVRVLVTHLGLRIRERKYQVQSLLRIVSEDPADFTFVLGDINEWRPMGFALRRLDAHFGKVISPRTFPSRWPVFRLDRIWASPPAELLEVRVPRDGLARVASDHLPIRAVFKLSNSGSPK